MQEYTLPNNVVATTSFVEAIQGAQYAIHAVPVQHSRKFLESIAVSSPLLFSVPLTGLSVVFCRYLQVQPTHVRRHRLYHFCLITMMSLQDVLPPDVPIISVSKGLEVGSGKMMSEVIPSALGRKQPAAFLSGPSFAKEIMDLRPTGVVAASKVAHQYY